MRLMEVRSASAVRRLMVSSSLTPKPGSGTGTVSATGANTGQAESVDGFDGGFTQIRNSKLRKGTGNAVEDFQFFSGR